MKAQLGISDMHLHRPLYMSWRKEKGHYCYFKPDSIQLSPVQLVFGAWIFIKREKPHWKLVLS